ATKEGRMPDTTVDGVKIHYSEAGEGEPLLLIMGYGMPGEAWLGSLPFLGGFRAIYYDNRGTGQSDRPGGPYPIEQMDEAGARHARLRRHAEQECTDAAADAARDRAARDGGPLGLEQPRTPHGDHGADARRPRRPRRPHSGRERARARGDDPGRTAAHRRGRGP